MIYHVLVCVSVLAGQQYQLNCLSEIECRSQLLNKGTSDICANISFFFYYFHYLVISRSIQAISRYVKQCFLFMS